MLLGTLGALGGPASPGATHVDVGAMVLREAWDFNRTPETLSGITIGADRTLWRGVAVRGELLGVRVFQQPRSAWLAGFTVGTRVRRQAGAVRPLLDIAVGLSGATEDVPAGGTRFNYLAVLGGGLERSMGSVIVSVTGRWFHASNNGREGRHRNPDVQSLGAVVSVGWEQ
jgi:hypothetical protein